MNWTSSPGDVEAYEVVTEKLSDGLPTSKYVMSIPTTEASLEGLGPNSSYRIIVSTVGMNTMRSQAVTVLCNTTVEGESPSFPQPCHRPQEKTPSVANWTWELFQKPVGPMWSCIELQQFGSLGSDAGTSDRLSNVWWACGSRDALTGLLVPFPALPPPLQADIFQVEASSTVIISSDLFSEDNGQIEYYGVVATTNDSRKCPCTSPSAVAP